MEDFSNIDVEEYSVPESYDEDADFASAKIGDADND